MRDALELDGAARGALLEREIKQIEERWKAEDGAHKAACSYCRTGTGDFCLPELLVVLVGFP